MNIIKPAWHWRILPESDPLYLPNIDGIALHHMAHPTADIWEVEKWHLQRDGYTWKGFGYNWWIGFDGTIYEGRGFNVGAGVLNENWHVISIGFQGNYYPTPDLAYQTEMPEAQLRAGKELIAWLLTKLPRKDIIIDGHSRWQATGCPGAYFPLKELQGGAKVLRIGNKGKEVEELQSKLNILGYGLVVDGDFGPATSKAVVNFQNGNGLDSDGVVGPATTAKLDEMIARIKIPPETDWKAEADAWKQKYDSLLGGVKALAERG